MNGMSFKYGIDPLQNVIHYFPRSKPKGHIILIHGGGWIVGNNVDYGISGSFPPIFQEDYHVSSIGYRLAGPGVTYREQISDIIQGINSIRTNLGITLPFFTIGESAGAHLCAMASFNGCSPSGVILLYGAYDLYTLNLDTPGIWDTVDSKIALMKAFGFLPWENEKLSNLASPIFKLNSNTPKTLLIHSLDDPTINVKQTNRMVSSMIFRGIPHSILYLNGAHHGDNFCATSPTKDTILYFIEGIISQLTPIISPPPLTYLPFVKLTVK